MPRKKIQNLYDKPLCFTTSKDRPYMLYNCINSILNQTFQDFMYCVNIIIKNEQEKELYSDLLKDFISDNRLRIVFSQNKSQHENYLKPITIAGSEKYNLFIKIDDDDIYKKQYIENVIALYKKNKKDILSCSLNFMINGSDIIKGQFDSIGQWPGDNSPIKFGMPCTYVFNQSAINILLKLTPEYIKSIHKFEDPAWRTEWRNAGLNSIVIKNFNDAIYNIHGKNISSAYMYNDSSKKRTDNIKHKIDNEYFLLCIVKHKWWESYCYFNKRNGRMYNINNDDHGAFVLKDSTLKIVWDNWGEENFIQKSTDENDYFELK